MTGIDINQQVAKFAPSQNPQDPIAPNPYRSLIQQRDAQEQSQIQQPAESSAPSPYRSIIEQRDRQEDAILLTNYRDALKNDPDFVAEKAQIERDLGVKFDENSDVKEVRRLYQVKAFKDRKLAETNPVLAWKMSDPAFAALAHDQIDNLSFLERMTRGFGKGRLSIERGGIGADMWLGRAGKEQLDRLLEIDKELAGFDAEPGAWESAGEFLGNMSVTMPRALATAVASGLAASTTAAILGQTGPQAATPEEVVTVPLSFGGGFSAGLTGGMFLQSAMAEGGNAFIDMTQKGYDPDATWWSGVGVAIVSGASETLGLKLAGKAFTPIVDAIKDVSAKELSRATIGRAVWNAARGYTIHNLGEGTTEAFQDIVAVVGEELAKVNGELGVMDTEQGMKELADRIASTFKTAVLGSSILAIPGASLNLAMASKKATRAMEAVKVFEALSEGDKQKLSKRDPGMYSKFVQAVAEQSGTPKVYINAKDLKETLDKAGISLKQFEEIAPDAASQLKNEKIGNDVVMTTGEWATAVAPRPELGKLLVPHMRESAEAMSAFQAQEFKNLEQALRSESKVKAEQRMAEDKAFRDSANEVEKAILEQLKPLQTQATTTEMRQFAGMVRLLYSVYSEKSGDLPFDAYQKNPFRITGTAPEGAQAGLAQIEAPDTPEFKAWFGGSKAVDAQGRPLRLFHGSRSPGFTEFQVTTGLKPGTGRAVIGAGIYLSERSEVADVYVGDEGAVYPVYARAERPFIYRQSKWGPAAMAVAERALRDRFPGDYQEPFIREKLQQLAGGSFLASTMPPDVITEMLRADGYDSVRDGPNLMVLDSAQVKSVYNKRPTNDPDILKSTASGTVKGEYYGDINTAVFYKKANFSTLVHELAHHYRAMLFSAAAASDGPTLFAADAQTLLSAWGLKSIDEFNALDQKQKVKFEEQFARWFEQWLAEGKAPSVELESLFRRFKNWLKRIYTDVIGRLNADYKAETGEDLPVLTDEVRGVFERMLATDIEIQRARAVRGEIDMLEFAAMAQKAGLSTDSEEWNMLRLLAAQDMEKAIDLLNSESVKDMQWLHNASIAEAKKLQAQHDAIRAKVRDEIEQKLASTPLFRAVRDIQQGKAKADDGTEVEHRLDRDATEGILVRIYPEQRQTKRKRTKAEITKEGDDLKKKITAEVKKDVGERRVYKMLAWLREKKATISIKAGLLASPAAWRDLHTDDTKRHGTVFSDSVNAIQPNDAAVQFGFDSAKQMMDELAAAKPVDVVVEEESSTRFKSEFKPAEEEVGVAPSLSAAARLARAREKLGFGKAGGKVIANGQNPELIAQQHGFASAEQMIRALINAPEDLNTIIDQFTDSAMLERYSELADPKKRQEKINEALAHEGHSRFVAARLNFLRRVRMPESHVRGAAREAAMRALSETRVSDIDVRSYRAAESRAAANAMRALKEGNLEDAIIYTYQELVQAEMGRLAVGIRKDIKSAESLFKNFAKAEKKLAKSRNMDFIMGGRIILAAVGKYPAIDGQKRDAWLAEMKQEQPEFYRSFSDMLAYASEVGTKSVGNAKNLTLDEFMELRDYAKSLWETSFRMKKYELDGKEIELDALIGMFKAALTKMSPADVEAVVRPLTEKQKDGIKFNDTATNLALVLNVCQYLDGGQEGGIFTRAIYRKMKTALEEGRKVAKEMLDPLAKRFDPISKTLKHDGIKFNTASLELNSEAEALGLVANTGTVSSAERVALYPVLTKNGVVTPLGLVLPDGTVDTSTVMKLVQEMADKGILTKERMDFIQSLWDTMEMIDPLSQAAHKKIHGYKYEKLEARPLRIQFQDGTVGFYRGGYMPAKYDPYLDSQTSQAETLQDLAGAAQNTRAQVPSGFTKKRAVKVSKPLRFDISVAVHHIEEAVRYAHVEPVVHDLLKVFRNKEFVNAMKLAAPSLLDKLFLPWLNRSARQITSVASNSRWLDEKLHAFRVNSGMNIMFSNIVNSAQQVTGLPIAAAEIGWRRLFGGLRQVVDPETWKFVRENSVVMTNRFDPGIRILAEEMQHANKSKTALRAIQRFSKRHPYWLQTMIQMPIDVAMWKGAYDKHLADLLNGGMAHAEAHKEAAARADESVIKTQGSRNPEDVANYEQATELVKTLTQFSGWSNMLGNNNFWKLRTLYRQLGWKGAAPKMAYHYLMTMLVPGIIGAAIVNFLGGRGFVPPDEDDDGFWDELSFDYLFMSQIRLLTSMVPGIGSAGMALVGAFTDKPYDDRVLQAPAITTFEQGARSLAMMTRAMTDENFDLRGADVKNLLGAVGTAYGIPTLFVGKPLGYLTDINRGAVDPEGPWDFIRGFITGSASPESKR